MQNDTQQKQSSQHKGADQKVSADRRTTSAGSGGRSASTTANGRAPSGNAVRSGQSGHAVEGATYRRRTTVGASSARSSGFATAGGAQPGTTHSTKGAQRHTQIKRKPYIKRRRRRPFPWRAVLIGLGVALLMALIIVLIVNASRGTHHMLPTVRRIEDDTPEPAGPEATIDAGLEQGVTQEDETAGDTSTAEPAQLPEDDDLTEAADFSTEPDVPAQDIDTADTITWNGTAQIMALQLKEGNNGLCREIGRVLDAAAGAYPPCSPCEGGLMGFRAENIHHHSSTAPLREAIEA